MTSQQVVKFMKSEQIDCISVFVAMELVRMQSIEVLAQLHHSKYQINECILLVFNSSKGAVRKHPPPRAGGDFRKTSKIFRPCVTTPQNFRPSKFGPKIFRP